MQTSKGTESRTNFIIVFGIERNSHAVKKRIDKDAKIYITSSIFSFFVKLEESQSLSVLSFVNILFLIAFVITGFIFIYMEFGWGIEI